MASSTKIRRQPVAQGGGMFSTQKATISKETQELLKVMMQESKLTNFQQRQLSKSLQGGQPLPLKCNPTSSASKRAQPNKKSTPKKPTSTRQGLRSKDTIEQLTDKDVDYRPAPARYDSAKEKQKLQNVMAYGSDVNPETQSKSRVQPLHQQQDITEDVDRFDEVMREIEERREFLEEMEALGRGKEYKSKIMTEISQKIRELEQIDKQRCLELTKGLQY